MDIWHGICPNKVNPYTRTKWIVEDYHYDNDIQRARKPTCLYTALTELHNRGSKILLHNQRLSYTFDGRLKKIGQFSNSEHRRIFLYAFLDTGDYTKECKHCGESVRDLAGHCLTDCKGMKQARHRLKLLMIFFNVPANTKLKHKETVIWLALSKDYLMKTLCEFLQTVWETK